MQQKNMSPPPLLGFLQSFDLIELQHHSSETLREGGLCVRGSHTGHFIYRGSASYKRQQHLLGGTEGSPLQSIPVMALTTWGLCSGLVEDTVCFISFPSSTPRALTPDASTQRQNPHLPPFSVEAVNTHEHRVQDSTLRSELLGNSVTSLMIWGE